MVWFIGWSFIPPQELTSIVTRSAGLLNIPIDDAGAAEIARRARGTPRIVNRLIKRIRDYAEIKAGGRITKQVAQDALAWLAVDAAGLDEMDRKILLTVIEKFNGGPVGVDSLAAAVQEDKGTLEDVYEPYLIQAGFLERTGRGRQATRLAFDHFKKQKDLLSLSDEAALRHNSLNPRTYPCNGLGGSCRILTCPSAASGLGLVSRPCLPEGTFREEGIPPSCLRICRAIAKKSIESTIRFCAS